MRIHKRIRQALDDTGLPWTIESGSKHFKVRLDGRLVAIYPQGTVREASPNDVRNTVANIRRAARS